MVSIPLLGERVVTAPALQAFFDKFGKPRSGSRPVGQGELVFNVKDYGASTSATPAANVAAIQAAVAAAKVAAGTRGCTVLIPELFDIDGPIILPRTGSSPVNVVQLRGIAPRVSGLNGTSAFPAGRALVEWESATSRAWHQSIADMSLVPALVFGCRAIHYRRNGVGTTLTDFNNERIQITVRDVLIEGHNGYHASLIKIEGQVFYSTFERIYGDNRLSPLVAGYQPLTDFDTATLEFDSETYGRLASDDIVGLSYSKVRDVTAGSLRRGGRGGVLRGKVKATIIDSPWSDGTRYDAGIDLINSFNVQVVNANNEGRSGVQIRVKDSRAIRIRDCALSAQDPDWPDWTAGTTYSTTQGVIIPGWRSAIATAAPANNNWYACTTAGTSGVTQPVWSNIVGQTVTDGTAIWTCMGQGVQDAIVIDGGDGVVLDGISSGPGLPTFTSRGCKALRLLNNPTNVSATVSTPGDPATEIAWLPSAGLGRFTGVRGGEKSTLGVDPFAAATVAANPDAIKPNFYRTPKGSTATTRSLAQNTEYAVPIDIPAGSTLDRFAVNVVTAVAASVVRLGVRADVNGYPGAVLLDAGVVDASTVGLKELTLSVQTTGVRVWLTATAQGATGVVVTGINGPVWPVESPSAASATTAVNAAQIQTGVTGALGAFVVGQGTVGIAPLLAARTAP